MAKRGSGGGDGLHELDSGLIHVADSLAGGPRGTYVDWFGAPHKETEKAGPGRDKGIVGKTPKLGTRFMEKS